MRKVPATWLEVEHKVDDCMIHFDVDGSPGNYYVSDMIVQKEAFGDVRDETDYLRANQPMRLEKYKQVALEYFYEMKSVGKTEPEDWSPDGAA